MGIFSFLGKNANGNKKTKKSPSKKSTCRLSVERLEDRCVPTCNIISGYVFSDANNNGLYEPNLGETPVANAAIKLVDSANTVVGTTTTDSTGFYQFDHDATISQAQQTSQQALQYATAQTDFSVGKTVSQFDPELGQLVSVDVIHNGTITSTIKVENTSPTSAATINATVSGTMTLTGPGFTSALNLSANAGTFQATLFDQNIDFAGTSGVSFAPQAASASQTITLTGNDIAGFSGTGTATLTETAKATSFASGGGNLAVLLASSGQGNTQVVYHYIPSNCLKPGDYTIVLNPQPSGYLPGKLSRNGTVLNLPPGVNAIPVTLQQSDLPHNDFGELLPAKISGYVYVDANDDGLKSNNESGIANVSVTLSGTNDLQNVIAQTVTTDANGYFEFSGLRPGTYKLSEAQPANYLDGIVTPGTPGGVAGTNQIASINLAAGTQGANNNFGELLGASLSGYAYLDANVSGTKDGSDSAIGGVAITLTGTNSQGSVQQTVQTDGNGFYQFANLRPGTYAITETQPSGYQDAQNNIGSQGGDVGANQFFNILLGMGVQGSNNNFGEKQVADLAIVKTASAASVQLGAAYSYTLTVSNLGPSTAQNVVVTDNLPAGVTYVSASGTGWTFIVAGATVTGSTITASRPALAAGETSIITINVKAPLAVGNVTNSASVTSTSPDPNPNNNNSNVTTTIYNQPGQVLKQDIPPLVTKAAIVSKAQLLPGGNRYLSPGVLAKLTFVDGVYRTLFNRPAITAEQKAGLHQLQNGMSTSKFVNTLWNRSQHWSWEVTKIYRTILHRSPTAAERAPWISSLQHGGTLREVRFGLLTSTEYLAQHSSTDTFVLGFYQDVLKEIPDSLTQANMVQALGGLDAADMANGLLNSEAAFNQMVSDGFAAVLHRKATAAEVQAWSAKLQNGQISEAGFLKKLLSSAEFVSLARNSVR